MGSAPEGGPQFIELRTYRAVNDPKRGIELLVDSAGWFYIHKLLGSEDCGPFTFEELAKELNLEPEPWRVTRLREPEPRPPKRQTPSSS